MEELKKYETGIEYSMFLPDNEVLIEDENN